MRDEFDKLQACVPLPEKVRWAFLKAILEGDMTFQEVATRAGMSSRTLRKKFIGDADFTLRDVGSLSYALDARIEIKARCLREIFGPSASR